MWVSKTSGGRVIGRELLSSEVRLIYAEELHWDLLRLRSHSFIHRARGVMGPAF